MLISFFAYHCKIKYWAYQVFKYIFKYIENVSFEGILLQK